MAAYYNEIDPRAAAWLRELMKHGLIAAGEVDERSIVDVRPAELRGFTQCHFFAGVGVWSYALRLAGWDDQRPVWTGSCPCQPFSSAGKGAGFDDERHLWPAWFHLIEQCGPDEIRGEQVASKPGLAWLDLVLSDLEGANYAAGTVDLCAAGVGAPHIRQRNWIAGQRLGFADRAGSFEGREGFSAARHRDPAFAGGGALWLADDDGAGRSGAFHIERETGRAGESRARAAFDGGGVSGELGNTIGESQRGECRGQRAAPGIGEGKMGQQNGQRIRAFDVGTGAAERIERPGPLNGFWRSADWLRCRDERWRPVEPDTFPLAHGAPARVGRLRGYGNAIVAQAAAEFIKATM